ncbi:hypothetical protein D9M68_1002140 [compost metagenome]
MFWPISNMAATNTFTLTGAPVAAAARGSARVSAVGALEAQAVASSTAPHSARPRTPREKRREFRRDMGGIRREERRKGKRAPVTA